MFSFCTGIDYRAICLFVVCLVYAVAGSPTPSTFGIAEGIIGALLLLAVGLPRARDAVLGAGQVVFWQRAGQIFLLYGLSVAVVAALLNGNAIVDVVRDIVPFLFLFLPLFLRPLIAQNTRHFLILLWGVVFIGLMFSIRSLLMRDEYACWMWCTSELLYLENMPTVLFAALFLIGSAFDRMMQGIKFRNIFYAVIFLVLSLIPLAAMVAVHQRASLGAAFLYVTIIAIYFFIKNPSRSCVVATALMVFAVLAGISFVDIFSKLSEKTTVVGLNMRPQEMAAVWKVVTSDPLVFLFGIGWGGHFHSPAVGGVSVNFTHNFFSGVLLKTGFCGVLIALAYVLGLLQKLSRVAINMPILGIAIAAPVLIDLSLYASFKSLDFGLMLLMISGSVVYFENSRTESSIAEPKCADRPLYL